MAKKEIARKPREIYGFTYDEFCSIWQNCSSAREASEKLGITSQYASMVAYRLRKRGIGLKRMVSKYGTDFEFNALNKKYPPIMAGSKAKKAPARY